jgi:SAM-dependent methyltransferase
MRELTCYACGSNRGEIVATTAMIRFQCYGSDKDVWKCMDCGLVQLYPRWTEEELKTIYENYNQRKDFPNQKETSKRQSPYVEHFIDIWDLILEVGCGKGGNVRYLKDKGYMVTGIDKDPSVCDGETIFNHDYREFMPPTNNFYDMIYALHLFEHIMNPEDFLSRCLKSLRFNGKILLELPNVDDPLLTVYDIPEFRKFYWRPDHVFFYNKETIEKLLKKCRIQHYLILRRQNYGLVNHINWWIRKKPTNLRITLPIVDTIYKWWLTYIKKKTDTLLVLIEKETK